MGCCHIDSGNQKLRKRKSLALASTFSRMAGSGSRRAISIAPAIVEKIAETNLIHWRHYQLNR